VILHNQYKGRKSKLKKGVCGNVAKELMGSLTQAKEGVKSLDGIQSKTDSV